MKVDIETTKLYYGFPVYLIGYKDKNFGYNITTGSSSYSLGDMLVMGVSSRSNACQQIKTYKQFTLNLVTEEMGLETDQAGWVSRRDKLSLTGLDYQISEKIDAPLITQSPLSIECQVETIAEFGSYTNFTARILGRQLENSLLTDHYLQNDKLLPLLYTGDGRKRTYRYMTEQTKSSGSYLKQAKNKRRNNNERTFTKIQSSRG